MEKLMKRYCFMSFSREDCEYTKFNIENHKIGFAISGVDDDCILISIPFSDDTPQCIKDKLNDIIYQEINNYRKTVECMSFPCGLRLNASMRIQCHTGKEFDPQYYLSIIITDVLKMETETWIEKSVNINSETSEFRNEFIPYCQYQVNKLLFPIK